MHAHLLADAAASSNSGILCTILLIATIIALIIGLAELIGLNVIGRLGGTSPVSSRFAPLVVGIILLVVYVVVC